MKDYEYILTVYEEKSFSKAAKKLFISQPALSMAVRRIETELGITIFDRSSLSLTLSDEGRIYIESLEQIRAVERTLKDRLSDIASLSSGKVIVSGENFVSSFILPEILMEFAKNYPGIQVELVESNSPDLIEQLLSETIDLLVAHDFNPKQFEARELFEETVLVAVPFLNPINKTLSGFAVSDDEIRSGNLKPHPAINLSILKDDEFLILKPGNDLHWRAISLCASAGFQPRVKIELDQLITSYNLAGAGLGISFVTDKLVKKAAVPGCVYYYLDDPIAHRKMSIGRKKNRYFTRAASAFVETACAVYSKH